MNFPLQLQKEAEKWAQLQGLSLEEFILQAVAEKVNGLNQQMPETSKEVTSQVHLSTPEGLRMHRKDDILVVETEPLTIDINAFIAEMREERIQGQMIG